MKNLLRSQEGALGMIMVIGFMALAVPLVTASLAMSSALSRDSQVKNDIMNRQYAALGVGEYVALPDPPGAPPALETTQLTTVLTVDPSAVSAGDTVTYTLTINNQGTELGDLSIVSVGLPPGFSYVDLSTTGGSVEYAARKVVSSIAHFVATNY